ncbi:hypothetical protein [Methylorubrum extorquens]|uniref:hypothetical protein n=1 Tax=Methylorubrum extorquens TaxID=408 RepID=UPI000158F8A3|nr:hypothetical protein [Methylorubrum extorquens]ABY30819.1 hypothetical protein Mext_2424 [Methylorubrum extorquens PA1]KQP87550.1 hypothetical protein ASF55_06900 [Methylobacterium sp. Leaf119]WIU42080.1 hypothetical protein KQ926_12625 [Methylorubrum extorquens]
MWVSKYALSAGIRECEVVPDPGWENIIQVKCVGSSRGQEGLGRSEWHTTFEAARARAEDMRAAEIRRLKPQIMKMEALMF